ncbi:MAG: hypothetical protein KDB25_02825 [Leucobacter sp.]|nr:hypothetical protein [Leucobacter sp.]
MRTIPSRISRGAVALAVALGLTVTAAPLAAQGAGGYTVSGSIYDIYGQPIQIADVTVESYSPPFSAHLNTFDGTFVFPSQIGLPSGSYDLKVKPSGMPDYITAMPTIVVSGVNVTGIIATVNLDEGPPPPTNAGSVSLQGAPVVGQSLSVSGVPSYPGTPGVVSYNSPPVYLWWRDDELIAGANDPSYTLTGADLGKSISVSVVTHPTVASPELESRFGSCVLQLGPAGPVTSNPLLGTPELKRTLTTVTLPETAAEGLAYTLTVSGTAEVGGLSYAMGTAAGTIPAATVLAKNAGVAASAVKRPKLVVLPIHVGDNPAQVNMAPSTTPGKYRIDAPVTQWLSGTAKATKTASSTLTLNANVAYSKAKTKVTRLARASGGYAVVVSAPAYQTGASVAVYDRLGSGAYRRVASGKLAAKSGKAVVKLTVAKKDAGAGKHTFYVNISSVKYAAGFRTAKQTYKK